MGLRYADFPIRGVDVSTYDQLIGWQTVHDFPVYFATIRVGYGKTTDVRFLQNWSNAKGQVFRDPYWYMDYYSNILPDEEWGIAQAEYCWNLIKDDMDGGIVWLDIEDGSREYSRPILEVWEQAQTIAYFFLKRMDELNGKVNGIYSNLSMLRYFDSRFRDRPLWLAWYNEDQSPLTVRAKAKEKGWKGPVLKWQYTANGDTDDDGVGDGIRMGLGRKGADLDIWIASKEEWDAYSNNWLIPTPGVPPLPEPLKLHYPLPEGIRISQLFGENPSWYPTSKGHNGIDWACPVGTPIFAMRDGTVIRADETSGKASYGRHVRIQHDNGISIYGHLSVLQTSVGMVVTAGQQIGLSGGDPSDPGSGFSTGPHLHGEYRLTDVPNPVPGGYVYNAIDLLPVLVSEEPELPPTDPLYEAKVTASVLNVRAGAGTNYGVIRCIKKDTVCNIYEEQAGWGRISSSRQEWISLYWTQRLDQPPVTGNWRVTAELGLRIRQEPSVNSLRIGVMPYNTIFPVSEILQGGWGKLADRKGYCALAYAVKIE